MNKNIVMKALKKKSLNFRTTFRKYKTETGIVNNLSKSYNFLLFLHHQTKFY